MKSTTKANHFEAPALLRQAILSKARDLFDIKGYYNGSMRRVGTQVGCSAMEMYCHFKSKEDLLMSICEETFTQITKQREDKITAEMEPIERLRTTMSTFVDFDIRYSSRSKLVFMTDLSGSTVTEHKAAIINRASLFTVN